jgi:broad specificity phosphatase PhoE
MKHLYFIRHGESVMNHEGIFSGRIETPLTSKGKSQAKAAGESLKNMPITIDSIVSSPMGRTMETAEIIADLIGYPKDSILTNHLFTERDFGPLEQTTFQPNLGDADGVETIAALIARAEQGLTYLHSLPGDTILLVSHGAIGRALRHCISPDIPFRPAAGFTNGEVIKLL